MTNSTIGQKQAADNNLMTILSSIKSRFPFLHYLAILHVFAFVLACLAIMVDDRELLGVNVWIKPAKFLISTFVFLWTVGWYLLIYPFGEKTKTWMGANQIFA